MILFERFPTLKSLPRVELVHGPTPLEPAPALGANVFIKRDDLTGGPDRYGGNKVRKLEFLLGEAVALKKRRVLTLGGTGSNHVIATAIYAHELGLETRALLFPQPITDDVRRKQEVFGRLPVEITRLPKLLMPFGLVARWSPGTYAINPGGSSPLGALGYVEAALELIGQSPTLDRVYAPLGSGGTIAGLAVGFKLAGHAARVVGVRVVDRPWMSARIVRRLADRIAALLRARGVDVRPPWNIDVVDDQLGPGYGAPTPAALDAVSSAAQAGLTVETTYGGKALAALLAAKPEGRVVFLHTYSTRVP